MWSQYVETMDLHTLVPVMLAVQPCLQDLIIPTVPVSIKLELYTLQVTWNKMFYFLSPILEIIIETLIKYN